MSGILWSVYTCALAYWVATSLSGYPLASLIISSLITSAALAAVYFVSKRKREKAEEAAAPTAVSGDPAIPPGAAPEK